jgi:hypothetical protein
VAGAWTYSDAWIFSSISGSDPETASTLVEVIGSADALSNAILMEEELTCSINRLTAAGLVDVDPTGERYWLTEAGLRLRSRAGDDPLDWIDTIPEGLHECGPPRDTGWSLTEGVFERALMAYKA